MIGNEGIDLFHQVIRLVGHHFVGKKNPLSDAASHLQLVVGCQETCASLLHPLGAALPRVGCVTCQV